MILWYETVRDYRCGIVNIACRGGEGEWRGKALLEGSGTAGVGQRRELRMDCEARQLEQNAETC